MGDHSAQAEATPTAPLTHAANDYDRTTRAIRRNIMLSEKLDQPTRHRSAARRQIIRAVEDNIHRHAEPGAEAEILQAELLDRLDRPDFEDELDSQDAESLITDIVRDLGLAAIPGLNDPWKRRTPAEIATLHSRAAMPANHQPHLDPARGAEWAKLPPRPLGREGMPTQGAPPPSTAPP